MADYTKPVPPATVIIDACKAIGDGQKALVNNSQTKAGTLIVKDAQLNIQMRMTTSTIKDITTVSVIPPKFPIAIPFLNPNPGDGSISASLGNTTSFDGVNETISIILNIVSIGFTDKDISIITKPSVGRGRVRGTGRGGSVIHKPKRKEVEVREDNPKIRGLVPADRNKDLVFNEKGKAQSNVPKNVASVPKKIKK